MEDNIISEKESNAIVIIRATAMFSIILCHLFQAYNNYLASVFNVGVQIFLVMSGYLYGKKHIDNWCGWYKKRFIKLYIPFIIVAASIIIVHLIFNTATIKWYQLLAYLTNTQALSQVLDIPKLGISGLSHLWFMTAIMFAYFSTPILQLLKKYSPQCIITMSIILLPTYLFLRPRTLYGLEWFWLYAFGYFFANLSVKTKKILISLFTICYLVLATKITGLQDITLWKRLGRCHHCTLSLLLFSVGTTYIRCLSNDSKTMTIFKWFDKYSFYIFLAHFPTMIGTFSLAHITQHLGVNILLMVVASAFLTLLLVTTTNYITKRISS